MTALTVYPKHKSLKSKHLLSHNFCSQKFRKALVGFFQIRFSHRLQSRCCPELQSSEGLAGLEGSFQVQLHGCWLETPVRASPQGIRLKFVHTWLLTFPKVSGKGICEGEIKVT